MAASLQYWAATLLSGISRSWIRSMRGEASQPPVVELRGITRVYGMGDATVRALDGVDLTIREGEFVALMGPSGSGKSTTMNVLGCIDTPTSGRYLFKGVGCRRDGSGPAGAA